MQKLLFACLLLTVQPSFAQKKAVLPGPAYPDYKWAVNWSPLALAQLDFTFLAGAEYRHTPKLSFVADAGYIFNSVMYGDRANVRHGQGFVFRPGIRLYTSTKGSYLQGQFFYKQFTNYLYDWLEKDIINNVSSYEQLQDFRTRRTAIGLNVVAGRSTRLGERIFLDFYIGAGVRYKTWSIVGEPNSRYRRSGRFAIGDFSEDRETILPSLPAGVRLVFIL